MNKKYELLPLEEGEQLHRIKALRDFGSVKAGDIGGYIQSEKNLSHDDNCWIFNNAKVCDNAKVYGNAKVYSRAEVYSNAEVTDTLTGEILNITGLRYNVTITDNHIKIGCKCYTKEEWNNFSDDKIDKMDNCALEFWKKYKTSIMLLAGVEV